MDVLAEKFIEFTHTPWVVVFLFIHSFLESSFLPGAHDIFLVAVNVARPSMCFVFALFSTLGSVCGGSFGYFLGRFGGRPLFARFLPKRIAGRIEMYFKKYGMWAIAVAGFTPLPYKMFAIAGGIFKLSFHQFFIVSLIARAMRFFLVSSILYIVGPQIKEYIISYFNVFSIACIIFFMIYIFIMLGRKQETSDLKESK
ncbi:YqaA family protein [Candidatus Omnitrophota bacterium]